MELRHLHYFIAVAEELHFGHAAARLKMAQPPLSQQIRNLEEDLGVLLFERSNRRQVTLTPAGQAFLREARRVLQQVDQARMAAQRVARGLEGELSIGFVTSVTYDILPRILRAFRARFPHVNLTLHELRVAEQLRQLRQERINIGIIRPIGERDGVEIAPILEEPLIAVLPDTHPMADQDEVALDELVREPLILSPADGCGILYDLVTAECRRLGVKPNIAQEATEIQIRVGLVASGLGVTLMPASVESFQRRGVVYRPLKRPAPSIELALAWREGERSALVQSFIDLARETVAASAPVVPPKLRAIPKTS